MNRELPRLHAITNDAVLSLPDFVELARSVACEGCAAIHIRSGSMDGGPLCRLAAAIQQVCSDTNSTVFVNDRVDVAKAIGAHGVHLPSTGLSVKQARSIVGPDVWVGRSTHTVEEVTQAAMEGADYVFLGPLWHTASHPGQMPIGPEALAETHEIPTIAIGGITPERASDCRRNGAYGVAAISALWNAPDVGSATRVMLLSFQS